MDFHQSQHDFRATLPLSLCPQSFHSRDCSWSKTEPNNKHWLKKQNNNKKPVEINTKKKKKKMNTSERWDFFLLGSKTNW